MISDTKPKAIEEYINTQLKGSEDVFLVEVKIIPGNNIKVFLDADNGITIEKCIKVNRALYKQIEESDLFPNGDFSLEVSSPGVDEPLKLHRQYKKNIGRTVEVTMNDGTKKKGKLDAVNDEDLPAGQAGIMLEERTGQGKKAVSKTTYILFNQVKHTKVLVTF
ncbi:MAG: ribosome assembly cofactor RimP [Bacteroidota bacterium]|nr:ribosome assembly cofactor RimP [Bacteroidota bacterium]